jgi:glycosyltransferase involved in cell wall biosynthesis
MNDLADLLGDGSPNRGDVVSVAGGPGRIILINRYFHPDLSATSQMVSNLAFELAAQGHAVHAIASRQRYDNPSASLPRHETVRGVTVHRIGTSRFGRGKLVGRAVDYATFHIAAAAAAASTAGPGDCVVACTDPPMLSVTIQPMLRPGTKLVNWLLDLFPEVASSLRVRGVVRMEPMLRRLRNRSLERAAMNIVLGGRMAALLTDQGIHPDSITIIPNCSDGKAIRPLPRGAVALRREWDLGDRFVVGYSGNMGRAHEFGTIVGAAEKLKDDPRILFLFVGDGHKLKEIRQEVTDRGLANVAFRPLQPEDRLCETLCALDVHLVTLLPELEGLIIPSKIYGVAAAGRPALFVGDLSGEVSTLLYDHDFGAAFAIGDVDGLADAIRLLSVSPELCRRLGENARDAFDRHFDRSRVVEKWQAMLGGLYAGNSTGTSMEQDDAALSGDRGMPLQRLASGPSPAEPGRRA